MCGWKPWKTVKPGYEKLFPNIKDDFQKPSSKNGDEYQNPNWHDNDITISRHRTMSTNEYRLQEIRPKTGFNDSTVQLNSKPNLNRWTMIECHSTRRKAKTELRARKMVRNETCHFTRRARTNFHAIRVKSVDENCSRNYMKGLHAQ